jgi:hypothetical protein
MIIKQTVIYHWLRTWVHNRSSTWCLRLKIGCFAEPNDRWFSSNEIEVRCSFVHLSLLRPTLIWSTDSQLMLQLPYLEQTSCDLRGDKRKKREWKSY